MNSPHKHSRQRKVRRTGRHTSPSQVEKVAEKAGKAAPAVVVVGALAAAPQAHDFTASTHTAATARAADTTVRATTVRAHLDAVVHASSQAAHAQTARSYTVQAGDTLSGIAKRFYGAAGDWRWLAHVNRSVIADANMILVGQVLKLPATAPANAQSSIYAPRHAAAPAPSPASSSASGSGAASTTTTTVASSASGTLSCTGLESLWTSAGGSAADAATAASIAMAESGGNQYATGSAGERGYWQINPVNGSLSTYDPYGNARAAVLMSANGTNWGPWTTYTSGAYAGRC